nr:cobalt-precorrin-5B (C(1))-methyltransferase [Tessaracoccus coleopterorum]
MHTGEFPDPVRVCLPKGHDVAFALTQEELADGVAMAAVQKDAGDDPDVTHGAVVRAHVRRGASGGGSGSGRTRSRAGHTAWSAAGGR